MIIDLTQGVDNTVLSQFGISLSLRYWLLHFVETGYLWSDKFCPVESGRLHCSSIRLRVHILKCNQIRSTHFTRMRLPMNSIPMSFPLQETYPSRPLITRLPAFLTLWLGQLIEGSSSTCEAASSWMSCDEGASQADSWKGLHNFPKWRNNWCASVFFNKDPGWGALRMQSQLSTFTWKTYHSIDEGKWGAHVHVCCERNWHKKVWRMSERHSISRATG